MRAQLTALLFVHDALKHRAENGGADFRPLEPAAVEKGFAHLLVELRDGQYILKQSTVDIAPSDIAIMFSWAFGAVVVLGWFPGFAIGVAKKVINLL